MCAWKGSVTFFSSLPFIFLSSLLTSICEIDHLVRPGSQIFGANTATRAHTLSLVAYVFGWGILTSFQKALTIDFMLQLTRDYVRQSGALVVSMLYA